MLWGFGECFCIRITWAVWPCCSELLIYCKSLNFYIFVFILSGESLTRIPKRKKKQRRNMSEWVSSRQRCWMEGKVWLIQGVRTASLEHVKDYRFLLFLGLKWGVFRSSTAPRSTPASTHYKWKAQSCFKTAITHPIQSSNLSCEKITETRQRHYPSPELRYSIVQDK